MVATDENVSTDNFYQPPNDVMKTALTPSTDPIFTYSLRRSSKAPLPTNDYHIFLYFAELQRETNESRVFNVSLDGERLYVNFSPKLLAATTLTVFKRRAPETITISLHQTTESTLPPLLNAIEVYVRSPQMDIGTSARDVDAVVSIKEAYMVVSRNWMGDPCNPKEFLWDGVNCTYDATAPSRIISLKLAYFGLAGEVNPSFGNLSELQYLDLSMNSLTGGIPGFLGNLPLLAFLNLTGSGLSGPVPKSLQDRVASGSLKLSYEPTKSTSKKSSTKIIAVVVAVIIVVAVSLAVGIFAAKRCRSPKDIKINEEQVMKTGVGESIGPVFHSESKQFTYAELVQITNNFIKKIGQGGFGIVYHGRLRDRKEVAVKMLSKSSQQGSKEFHAEAQVLTKIYHRNLVPLLGYSKDNNTFSLVYEYMANGSLEDHLSGVKMDPYTCRWRSRLQIGLEAAHGLEYLHSGCRPSVIHRDVKASNILLNSDFEAKIADFGLSKILYNHDRHEFISTAVVGTPGYLDPEYSDSGHLNEKSDVYSFGVVLLQLITGKRPISKMPEMIHIVSWVEPLLEKGDLNQIVDPRFGGEFNQHSVWKALEVAMACLAPTAMERPSMNDVLPMLKDCLKLESTVDATDGMSYNSMEQFPSSSITIANPRAR